MKISNELSSEIANALLTARERSPEELTTLKKILLEVHSALQSMEGKYSAHKERRAKAATNQVGDASNVRN